MAHQTSFSLYVKRDLKFKIADPQVMSHRDSEEEPVNHSPSSIRLPAYVTQFEGEEEKYSPSTLSPEVNSSRSPANSPPPLLSKSKTNDISDLASKRKGSLLALQRCEQDNESQSFSQLKVTQSQSAANIASAMKDKVFRQAQANVNRFDRLRAHFD